MDVDVSAIGYSFARSVDKGKVQASNQVLWDVHLNRAGLAQHWNYKKSPQNNRQHYKSSRELGKGYINYYWAKSGIICCVYGYYLTIVIYLPILHFYLQYTNLLGYHCPISSWHSDATKDDEDDC